MTVLIRTAVERRKQLQARAAAMGIDEAYISLLVDQFYRRVRDHPMLGPIFDKKIGENWDAHLLNMKAFWTSVALNAGDYSGKPVPKHVQLTDVRPAHFNIWLGLFRRTLEDTAPSPEVVIYFMERAERIAQSLQFAMFSIPEITQKSSRETAERNTGPAPGRAQKI